MTDFRPGPVEIWQVYWVAVKEFNFKLPCYGYVDKMVSGVS